MRHKTIPTGVGFAEDSPQGILTESLAMKQHFVQLLLQFFVILFHKKTRHLLIIAVFGPS